MYLGTIDYRVLILEFKFFEFPMIKNTLVEIVNLMKSPGKIIC